MNENYVVQIIDALSEKFGIAIDWTSQNVMPYIENLMSRIVSYEIGINIFWMIFCPLMFVAFCLPGRILTRKSLEAYNDDWCESAGGIIGLICYIVAIGWLIATLVVVPTGVVRIVECVNIPEKVFFDYIKNALSTGC